jgi:hypothetical protein
MAEQAIEKDIMELRADKNKCYKFFLKIIQSKLFTNFIAICIAMNTVVLAMDSEPIDPNLERSIEYVNLLFYMIFVVEMACKMIGQGSHSYFKESQNIFDMIIVILSTVDVFLFFSEKLITHEPGEDQHSSLG